MIIEGKISIDMRKETATIQLDNESFALDHYPQGIKRFIEEEIKLAKARGSNE